MDCEMCNGRGYTGIVMGDNDMICKVCGGTGDAPEQPINTVAIEAPLSPEAELRLQLAAYDNSIDDEWPRRLLMSGITRKFHMLLSLLDASRKENVALRESVQLLALRQPDPRPLNKGEIDVPSYFIRFGRWELAQDIYAIINREIGKRP